MNKHQSIFTYWRWKIIAPGGLSLIGIVLITFFGLGYQAKMEHKRINEAVVKTIASSLVSPLLLADEIEIRRLIYKGGKVNNFDIKVYSKKNNILVKYFVDPFKEKKGYFKEIVPIKIISPSGHLVGHILVKNLNRYNTFNMIYISVFIILFLFLFILVRISFAIRPLLTDLQKISLVKDDKQDFFFKEIYQTSDLINNQAKQIIIHENNSAITSIASQVAHDIRSPLAALDMASENLDGLPEDTRVMLRVGISRIRDIANNLLDTRRNDRDQESVDKVEVVLLSSLIESIVSEKRTQNRNMIDVRIKFEVDSSMYGLFSKVDHVEFKRLLSNLINNAVEAFKNKKGDVTVFLFANEEIVQIKISDNGMGMPDSILKELGRKGSTFGKENGNSLGVYHAKKTIEDWNGKFKVESKEGIGTDIIIDLKRSETPSWFVKEIVLKKNIVILDDDETIHKIWDKRLKAFDLTAHNVFHFTSGIEAKKWFIENGSLRFVFLCDYELLGQDMNGLELIEELNISFNSILVTSRYEEDKIKNKCERLMVSLIPKPLAAIVPISNKNAIETSKEAVFIDDEMLLRMGWEMQAKKSGIILHTFDSPKDFRESKKTYDKGIPFYIDSSFGADEINGEDLALELFEQGYENLYLATGYEPEKFSKMPFLKGVIGKTPPWDNNLTL